MATDKKDDEDIVVVEVPEDTVTTVEADQPAAGKQDEVDDKADDQDGDDQEDARAGHDADKAGETDDQKRERRRLEKKRRREARRRYIEMDQAELARLRAENSSLVNRVKAIEGRTVQQDVVLVTNRISQLEQQIREADSIIIQARAAGNHADSLEAEQIKRGLETEIANLNNAKSRLVQTARTQEAAPATQARVPPAVDPVVKALAEDWLADKQWLLKDAVAQAKVRDIDSKLVAEGLNPRSIKFWNELEKRVNKVLPKGGDDDDYDDDADDDADTQQRGGLTQRGPAMTSGGGGGGSGGRRLKPNEVIITPARKQAMIDAGAWEDPDRRKKMLKSFHEWDRQNPANRTAAAR